MGLFDEVCFTCLDCGGRATVQSKAGDCEMHQFSADEVPVEIAADVIGEYALCDECGTAFEVQSFIGVNSVPMRIVR